MQSTSFCVIFSTLFKTLQSLFLAFVVIIFFISLSFFREEEERPLPKNPFFTGCLGQVPAVILVLLAILIVLFVVFSIPLVFVFTQSSYQQMPPPTDDKADAWPNDDDYGYQNESISKLAALLPKNVTMCRGMGFVCANHPVSSYLTCL